MPSMKSAKRSGFAERFPEGSDNQTDRFSFAIGAIDRVPKLQRNGAHAKEELRECQLAWRRYAYEHGIDSPEISRRKGPYAK
jgi:xylulose-5-phosphate/fructose-6-phosphate phosphoketolase